MNSVTLISVLTFALLKYPIDYLMSDYAKYNYQWKPVPFFFVE